MRRAAALLSILFAPAANGPAAAPANENWPDFRGPTCDGHADPSVKDLPLAWSDTENVKWKIPLHGKGWSSPVIWGNLVWTTTAAEDGKQMFAVCVDRESGKVLHDVKVFENDVLQTINPANSWASPSPVVEAGRVYVHFGTYGTACLDTASGKVLWQRRDLTLQHKEGPGSSPCLYGDLLLLHCDGMDVRYVVALDKKTGKTVWKRDRSNDLSSKREDLRKAYCTPFVATVGGQPQVLSIAAFAVFGYDPKTGKELWSAQIDGFSNTSRPVVGHGLAFVGTGFMQPQLWAVRLGGAGDVTKTHIAWKMTKGAPLKPSVLLVDDLLYVLSDGGVLTCLEAKTGKEVWKERMEGGEFSASPILADGKIFVCSHEGRTTVVKPGRTCEKLAVNALPDGFMASPAAVGKALYLRTKTSLYRIEKYR